MDIKRYFKVSDNRILCKYGAECYQKNPAHHEKYKHPEKRKKEIQICPEPKKQKNEKIQKSLDPPINASVLTNQIFNLNKVDIPDEFYQEIVVEDVQGDFRSKVKEVFIMDMPDDFYSFFSFCELLAPQSPSSSLQVVGLKLVGAYDILCGKVRKITKAQALLHHRYHYDPPEFQTVIASDKSNGFHFGYFRDDPSELPHCIASNESQTGCEIKIVAPNIFGAVNSFINSFKKTTSPFLKMKVELLQSSLIKWSKSNHITLDTLNSDMKSRRSKIVTKSFHGAGIVVPYDRKTEVGYRELAENYKSLKKILDDIVETSIGSEKSPLWTKLQNVITYANIANDECDFGTSLELGINLFCQGNEVFHRSSLQLLKTAYGLLGRQLYSVIANLHFANRRKEKDLPTV